MRNQECLIRAETSDPTAIIFHSPSRNPQGKAQSLNTNARAIRVARRKRSLSIRRRHCLATRYCQETRITSDEGGLMGNLFANSPEGQGLQKGADEQV